MAIAFALRTKCSAKDAAKEFGVHVSTVKRGLAREDKARPVGRPAKT